MSKEDLIPLTERPIEVAQFLRKKGGTSKSPLKKDAAKWREIKKRLAREGITDPDKKWMLEKLENRDAWSADIMMYIEEIKTDIHPAQRVALGNLMKETAKFHHGDKIKTENTNLNINMDLNDYLDKMYEKRKGE